MKHFATALLAASSLLGTVIAAEATSVELYDPTGPGAEDAFIVINDGVMGGLTTSHVAVEGGALVFSGTVRLENDGGFASMRTRIDKRELGGFTGIELVVRGDGQRYKLNLRDDLRSDGVSHQIAFETRAGKMLTLRFPFEAFEPRFRGRRVPTAPPLDRSRIQQLGVLISDEQAGEFRLELFAVRAYR